MFKLYVILVISSVLLGTIRTVDSIDCYKCFSADQSTNDYHLECERGSSYNIDRGPCKKKGEVCYKIVGVGQIKDQVNMTARGCWNYQHYEGGFKNYPSSDPFSITVDSKPAFNIVGKMYMCKTNLCNASNGFSSPVLLLTALGGFSLLFKSHHALV